MYRIGIADDEKYVLKSIMQRIRSSGMELDVVGTAGNGVEALELYEKEQPDIFFVDINMPVVNGLDFIEKIRKRYPEVRTRFIIISGYDDFAYMKKAIQLGVINYIKKPILQQEFSDMLCDVCRQLEEERDKEEKKEENIRSWTDFLHLKKQKDTEGTYFLIRGKEIGSRAASFLQELAVMEGGQGWNAVRFYGVTDILLLIWEGIICSGREIEAITRRNCFSHARQIVYMTGKCRNPEEMIGQFEDTLNIRFYHPEYRVMKIKNQIYEKPGIFYEAFDAALENAKENKYTECLDEIMKPIFVKETYCNLIKQVYQSVVLLIANKYTKYDLQLPVRLRQELFPFATAAFGNKKEMMARLVTYSEEINIRIGEILSRSDLVDKVIQYIGQHYKEEINLSELAGEFYVVPTYLAKRFKEKKNCTVMQYLENMRLKKARELLESSPLSISDIAIMVGYNDPNYFARSFKKVYDLTPREYRNTCGGE
nr:response regulator [uncultured Eisenbergiella sp.]